MNIYSLYITRSHDELKYFNKILDFIKQFNNYQIVHLHFKSNDRCSNLTINKKNINVSIYTPEQSVDRKIKSLNNLIKCYQHKDGKSIWIYSGHSDGMYLKKKNIKILRIEDFCKIIQNITGTADLMILDCCLCGNINCLSICYQFTDYLIASTSYQSMISFLYIKELYQNNLNIVSLGKQLIKSAISLENKNLSKSFPSAFILYHLNETLLQFFYMVMYFKHLFKSLTNYVIDKKYYKDIECCFKELGFDISGILKEIIIYQRYPRQICRNKTLPKNADYSIPSRIMIVTKRPCKNITTDSDCFLI